MSDLHVETPPGERDGLETLDAWIADLVAATDVTGLSRQEVRYGEHAEQVIDLWQPEQPRGAAVLLHGGGFAARFDRHIMLPAVVDLCRRGHAVWNVEYRRTDLDGGPVPTTQDVAAALECIAHSPLPGQVVDRPLTLVAHSAGGYLALWAARLPLVEHVIVAGAVCDLAANAQQADDMYARFVGGLPGERSEVYGRFELARRLPTHATHALICGLDDQPHRVRENRAHAAALAQSGDTVVLEELPGVGHFDFLDPASSGWLRVVALLEGGAE